MSPNGSGTACTESNPCSWQYGTGTKASGSDTVRWMDGIYNPGSTDGFKTSKDGTSAFARMTWESVNRHGAKLRYIGDSTPASSNGLIVRHNNYIIRGLEVICRSPSNGWSWDCVQVNGNDGDGLMKSNVLFDDLYVHESGHQLFGCYLAQDVEVRNSTFDYGGETGTFGECNYLTSSSLGNRPCIRLKSHHNIFSRCGVNYIDQKNQTRSVDFYENIFMDKRQSADGGGGDADFVASTGGGTATNQPGNYVRNNIVYRPISNTLFESEDGHRVDYIDNVIMDYTSVTNNETMNSNDMIAEVVSSGNLHCPASDNINLGVDRDHGGTPNSINRPMSECITRRNEILGIPGISSCEIGSISSTTMVVNLQADKNGPISSVGTAGQLAVTYDGTDQTETAIVLTSGTQARITLAAAPTSGQSVRVTPAIGAIKNSAFIGGKTCGISIDTVHQDPGGTSRTPNKIANGQGVCGTNLTATQTICTNNVGTAPGDDSLTQDVWRFYAQDGHEAQNPLAPENASLNLSLGDGFRWRVGVRGGGNNAPSRSYALASRICNPTCGQWLAVTGDFSATGITFRDDLVQIHGTPTTNLLSLAGKTFLAGAFIEIPVSTPSVAITTAQQVEWEWSLIIPRENNPLSGGQSIELRMQHSDGTELSSYVTPSISIGSGGSGFSGSFVGGVIQ